MLLETETLRIAQHSMKVAERFGLIPWTINVKRRRLRVIKSPDFYLHFKYNQFLLYCSIILGFYIAYILATFPGFVLSDFVMYGFLSSLAIVLCYTFGLGLVLHSRSELAGGINTAIILVDTLDRFGGLPAEEIQADAKFGRDLRKALNFVRVLAKYLGQPLFCVLPLLYWNECLQLCLAAARPIENLLGIGFPIWLIALGILTCLPFYWYLGLGALWFAYVFIVESFTIAQIGHHIFRKKLNLTSAILNDSSRETIGLLRHPKNAMMIHRACYILVQTVRNLCANILATFYSIVLVGLSSIIYFIAIHRGPLIEHMINYLLLGLCGFYWTFLIHAVSEFHTMSVNLLDSWRYKYFWRVRGGLASKVERRILRSLLPLRFYAGSFYYFDKTAPSTYVHHVIDKSVVLFSCFPAKNPARDFRIQSGMLM